MKRLAKIIHLSAYIDKNGKRNTIIPQHISEDIYNTKHFAQILQYKITAKDPYYDATYQLIYQIYNNIGIYGDEFKDKNNNKFISECQLGILTNESIIQACKILDNELNQSQYLSPNLQQELTDKFEDYLYNNHYFLVYIIYKNGIGSILKFKFFNQSYTIEQLRNKSIQIINKYKQLYF